MREDTKSLEAKQKYLEKSLAKIGVGAKFCSIKWDYWQTVLSRAGVEIAPLLVEVYKRGGKIGAYKSALKDLKIDISKAINGYDIDETLPWDVVENYPRKQLLINEFERLKKKIDC